MTALVRLIGSILCILLPETGLPLSPNKMDPFYMFWFNSTIKFMNSSSFAFKLAAWEQLNEIIHEAKVVRPIATSYVVEGAGTPCVNGEYVLFPRDGHDDDYIYKKVPTAPNMPLLTLFKCTMRSKDKWWFISQADVEKPGTERDIDYYLHRSTYEDDKEAARCGWTHESKGVNLIGVAPSPSVKKNSLDLPKDITKEMYLDYKLLAWVLDKDLLSYIYGSPIHREIVSCSGKFLIFLAEYDALKKEHLSLIWKSAIDNPDIEIIREVFTQLVPLTMYLNDVLFSHLMMLALESLRENSNYSKVAIFVETFNMDHKKFLLSAIKSTSPTTLLLTLLWEIYKNPSFENLTGCNVIKEILFVSNYESNVVPVQSEITVPITMLYHIPNTSTSDAKRSEVSISGTVHVGAIATVHKGIWKESPVAFKVIRGDNQARAQSTVQSELAVLTTLRHPRILTLMAVCRDLPPSEGTVGLLTEFMERGSLYSVLHEIEAAQFRPKSLRDKLRTCLEVSEGLCFLHQSRFIHRDVKSANVLVDRNGHCKVSDFGLSKYRELSMTHVTGVVGTVAWSAPEVLRGEDMRESADVYSFGVVAWEVFTGKRPWEGLSTIQIISAVAVMDRSFDIPPVSEMLPQVMKDLMMACLDRAQENRPTFGFVVKIITSQLAIVNSIADIPLDFICPITMEVMNDPVICADGHSYERSAINMWLQHSQRSPKTNLPLLHLSLISNHTLRMAIEGFRK